MSNHDSNDIVFAEFEKNSREVVRVALSVFKGQRIIAARCWAENKSGGRVPTKNGLNIRLEQLDALIGALTTAKERIAAMKGGGE